MPYLVKVPLVLAHGQATVANPGGHVDYYYEGATIPWLNDDEAERFVAEGYVEQFGRKVKAPEVVDDTLPTSADEIEAPPKAARHDLWVDYAVFKGADRTEAEALTKAELIELYG